MSMLAPGVSADMQTQLQNLINRVSNLEKIGAAPVAQNQPVIYNPNSSSAGDSSQSTSVPQLPTTYTGSGSEGYSSTIDPVTGLPLPNAAPIIIQQGVLPVTGLSITPGANLNNIYADVTWDVSVYSNAIQFTVLWGTQSADGKSINYVGSQDVHGNQFRINNLLPNTMYGLQVVASNLVGQYISTPATGYQWFESIIDQTIPPAVGGVVVGSGATSVIVEFDPLTVKQAPDVANGAGIYDIQVTNDPTFNSIVRETRTSSFVVSFNDIYPHTTLVNQINATDGAGTSVAFADLSQVTPGHQFQMLIDNEYITFNAPTGNTATIAVRNSGTSPLVNGPQTHLAGAKATLAVQTLWYARVAPIDSSGNQGPWSNSSGAVPAGSVTDSMLVGDFSAAHITFGQMSGALIEVDSLQANAIATSTLIATTITLGAGGQIAVGNPPNSGIIFNSQGLTAYNNSLETFSLNGTTGVAAFSGNITGSDITGSKISGTNIDISGGTMVCENGQFYTMLATNPDLGGVPYYSGGAIGPCLTFGNYINGSFSGEIVMCLQGSDGTLSIEAGLSNSGVYQLLMGPYGASTQAFYVNVPGWAWFEGSDAIVLGGNNGNAIVSYGGSAGMGIVDSANSYYVAVDALQFNASSSETVKKNIRRPEFSSLEFITKKAKVKEYKYQSGSDNWHLGPIAEEMPEHYQIAAPKPNGVDEPTDSILSLNVMTVSGMAWHAIEELNAKVEALEEQLAKKV